MSEYCKNCNTMAEGIINKNKEIDKLQAQLTNSVDYGWKLEARIEDLQHKVTVLQGINKLMETHHDTEIPE